ncbi:hypothetical protein [Luteimonas sp. A482]
MRPIRALLLATLLALPTLAAAQQAPPLEQAMSSTEFKAAGLDKLSAEELARLNAWLDRRVEQQTSAAVAAAVEQAREEGRKEVVTENRGFFHFGSQEPIEASIAGEFAGFGSGRRYTLDNGQVWEQTDSATLSGVRKTNPKVRIKPGVMGVWWLRIDGYNTQAKVQRIE